MYEGQRVAVGYVIANEVMDAARTDESALELAVRQHARLVYRIAYSVLRNHQDAEDATQETFIRVMRAQRKLATVDDPRRWLARIAWRVAVAKKRKTPDVALEDVGEVAVDVRSHAETAADRLIATENTRLLQALIPNLPRGLREPLVLSTLQEMSTPDIASTLGISEAAVRSRIFRARQILREKLNSLVEGKHEQRFR
jgi:RNA polymerase sigma-70 factor (ECF subfamily)